MSLLQTHGFDWNDNKADATPEKYGRCKSSLEWFYDSRPLSRTGKTNFSIKRLSYLREFLMENPPDFAISDKCCYYAKKRVSHEFDKEYKPDLVVTGMRRAEGGRRAGSIQTCFTPNHGDKPDNYRPLWYWSDADKAEYKAWRGLRYSDCYKVWGLKRTGCVGCPCNSKAEQELEIIEQYEPQLVKAARGIFGASYVYKRQYNEYKIDNKGRKTNV
jgi:3'-phosphoadenosine 5'-phosphosulfate sulfotransferase (PAPS reductase)/FAD synthetase